MQGRLIRQVQQLSHTTGQRLGYASWNRVLRFLWRNCAQQKMCVLEESFTLVVYICAYSKTFS